MEVRIRFMTDVVTGEAMAGNGVGWLFRGVMRGGRIALFACLLMGWMECTVGF